MWHWLRIALFAYKLIIQYQSKINQLGPPKIIFQMSPFFFLFDRQILLTHNKITAKRDLIYGSSKYQWLAAHNFIGSFNAHKTIYLQFLHQQDFAIKIKQIEKHPNINRHWRTKQIKTKYAHKITEIETCKHLTSTHRLNKKYEKEQQNYRE